MIKIGTLVRILHPDYVAGCRGIVQDRENENRRWIIKLEETDLKKNQEAILLSLDESDFEPL
ncbi:MAG: hypothetical protein AB4057_12155 [Crocosphaera sp.]